ncbi:RNA-directed DNA polymerase, eukaryota, reverse transcriptase zinc-binding domain protein [Tanacetum coccineum]
MLVRVNSTFITLLPKILAKRLASVGNNIVTHEQSAFIVGRQILDSPFTVSEVIDLYTQCSKKSMIFKVNYEKAYDLVHRKYLDYILEQFGFGMKWRDWTRECLQSACTCFLINGSPTSEFSIKRELRQGDMLCPYLFILIMKGLHIAINDAVQASLISTVKVGTMYYSSTRWQTRQYEVLFRWRLDQSACDTWHSARVSTRFACVSTRSDYGNNVEVGGRQNDQNTPRSSNISGWRPEMTNLPPPTLGYKREHASAEGV